MTTQRTDKLTSSGLITLAASPFGGERFIFYQHDSGTEIVTMSEGGLVAMDAGRGVVWAEIAREPLTEEKRITEIDDVVELLLDNYEQDDEHARHDWEEDQLSRDRMSDWFESIGY